MSELSTLIAALFGGGTLAALFASRKTAAEAESISVTTLRGVVEDLRDEIARKDDQISRLSVRLEALEAEVQTLRSGNAQH